MILLSSLFFLIIEIHFQQGLLILPFEVGKNDTLSGTAIADLLTAEMMRIQQIHNIEYRETTLETKEYKFSPQFSTEEMPNSSEMILPKAEIIDFSLSNIGTIGVGSNSLSLGNILITLKNIYPFGKRYTIIRGSLQRYGSTVILVSVLEEDYVKSWIVTRLVDNEEERFHEMVRDLAFMIIHDLPYSRITSKTSEGLKFYTESLDAYNHYILSGNADHLYIAGNYSLKAISSEKGYRKPFDLLLSLEAAFAAIGRQGDSMEYCNRTIELDPGSAESWFNRGCVFIILRNYDQAIMDYDAAIRLDPTYAITWNNKGFALSAQKKFDQAIMAYDEAIRLDPTYAQAWDNKGLAFYNQKKYDQALVAYDAAIRLDPTIATVWNNKGNVLFDLRKYDGAMRAYAEAIRLDPSNADSWIGEGNILYNEGKYDEAMKAYAKAKELGYKE